jgi:large repetitive protein
VTRRLFALLSLLATAGLCSSALAQTAPQLLPYTSKLIAGGGTTAIGSGATCPVSGFTSTDAYGDGCLATEVQLVSPRYAIADINGNIFFSDYNNGLVRRVDAVSGVVTAVAGGAAASPAASAACGANTSTDARGDGCLSTLVKLSHPSGLAFSPSGDLYFSDIGYANIRKVAATSGLVTTGGVISLVAGNVSGTFGYASGVVAATGSYLQDPYGISFDSAGNLYIADEYTKAEAVLVVNTNTSGSTTVTGVTIPAGQIVKIAGTVSTGGTVCPNSPASTNGCTFGNYKEGAVANASQLDGPWAAAADPAGNVYVANEFNSNGVKISAAGIINTYGGIQASAAKVLQRGPQGSFAIGSVFGVVADANSNVYLTDASNGVVWRIDNAGQSMYVVAGGASTVCSTATDTYGDGCPATQATFGKSGTGNFASTTLPGPGIYGITEDAYNDLFVGDTENSNIREIASGTQFGRVGGTASTQTVDIHFAPGDAPAASAYSLIAGGTNFSLGSATCTANSDTTQDCLLPVTAKPTGVLTGSIFTGTLQVMSKLGTTATFPLSGEFFGTPVTTTAVTISASCAGNTIFLPTTPVTLNAMINSSGSPGGTVTFFANGTQIGSAQPVANGVATLSYTFATAGTYTISANYSGDSYFTASTGQSSTPVYSENPNLSMTTASYPAGQVYPGGTAAYSFNLAQNVYTGTITFALSGMPPNSTYSISPTSIASTGCTPGSTVALSILTQQGSAVLPASFGMFGRGKGSAFSLLASLVLAFAVGMARRRARLRFGQIWMVFALLVAASSLVACNSVQTSPSTPAGKYTVTVTATGSTGVTSTLTLPPFTVN